MAKYADKWKKTFPESIGNEIRPADGVDNTQAYNTDAMPQYMANDPVRFDLQNAINSQLVSNDERLKEKIDKTNVDLSAHDKNPKAHTTGIAGNAASATKLQTARTLALSGKAAGSATFDGSANANINVTAVTADTASKLSTPRTISLGGNATGSANFDGSNNVTINTTVNQAAHANNADVAKILEVTDGNGAKSNGAFNWIGKDGQPAWLWGANTKPSETYVYNPSNFHVAAANTAAIANKGDWQYKNDNRWYQMAFTLDGEFNWYSTFQYNPASNVLKVGTVQGNITGSADSATNADKVDGYHENSFLRYRGVTSINGEDTLWNQIGIKEYNNVLPESLTGTYTYGAVISFPSHNNRLDLWYDCYASNTGTGLYYRTGWANEKRAWARLLDSNNYTKWAPTKTGGGASGTWGISITGNADSASLISPFEIGTANVFRSVWFSDSDANNKACYNPNIQYNPASNVLKVGTVQGNLAGNANTATNVAWSGVTGKPNLALKDGDTIYTNDWFRSRGSTGWYNESYGGGWYMTDSTWIRAFNNKSVYTPAKMQADGGFYGNLQGTATNADTVDGYHASDLLRTLGGNKAPVMTDIFDRAGTIDLTALSAADKARHKTLIDKSQNTIQNLWNNTTGIHSYGGDVDMANGYPRGTLKLTQSYKNFDKILVVASGDDATWITYRIWDAWKLAHAFNSCFAFDILGVTNIFWIFYGTQQHGTGKFAWSTDTVWSCREQNCGIIAIYGIKY